MTTETGPTGQPCISPQETSSGHRILETRTSIRIIFPRNLIPEILARCGEPVDEESPAHYAQETAHALEKTREVVLARWLERNQTVIYTPTSATPLNEDEISSCLKILLHQEDILYERVLKELGGGKKVILSSSF